MRRTITGIPIALAVCAACTSKTPAVSSTTPVAPPASEATTSLQEEDITLTEGEQTLVHRAMGPQWTFELRRMDAELKVVAHYSGEPIPWPSYPRMNASYVLLRLLDALHGLEDLEGATPPFGPGGRLRSISDQTRIWTIEVREHRDDGAVAVDWYQFVPPPVETASHRSGDPSFAFTDPVDDTDKAIFRARANCIETRWEVEWLREVDAVHTPQIERRWYDETGARPIRQDDSRYAFVSSPTRRAILKVSEDGESKPWVEMTNPSGGPAWKRTVNGHEDLEVRYDGERLVRDHEGHDIAWKDGRWTSRRSGQVHRDVVLGDGGAVHRVELTAPTLGSRKSRIYDTPGRLRIGVDDGDDKWVLSHWDCPGDPPLQTPSQRPRLVDTPLREHVRAVPAHSTPLEDLPLRWRPTQPPWPKRATEAGMSEMDCEVDFSVHRASGWIKWERSTCPLGDESAAWVRRWRFDPMGPVDDLEWVNSRTVVHWAP